MDNYTKTDLVKMLIKSQTMNALIRVDSQVRKIQQKFKNRVDGKFTSKEKTLGIDFSFIRHHADIPDLMKQLGREIKWGLQRFWNGYDDQMFWSLDTYLDELIMISLEWYINNRNGSPVMKDWTEENCHEKFTAELKKMLSYFEQADDRWCKEKNEYDDIVDLRFAHTEVNKDGFYPMEYADTLKEAEELRNKWSDRNREIEAYKEQQHKKALRMLVKYYRNLWD